MAINLLEYVEYLQCQQGRSLNELAENFKNSVRSVQRHLAAIQVEYPNTLTEAKRGNQKVFRCTQPKAFVGVALKASDVIMIHTLNKAVHALQQDGCVDDADVLIGFVAHLRRNIPRAAWKRCEELLARLAACDNVKGSQTAIKDGIKRRVQLAVIADRDAKFILHDGSTIIGKPMKMQEGVYGACLVVCAKDGECVIPLADIETVGGVDDVLAKQFAA